jgi:protein-disulfide isomerase
MSKKLTPPVNEKDHVQGDAHAAIELVEYGDYQCPHCGRAYPIIKRIQKKMGKDLKFIFRNFPLSEMHPQAFTAAVATEAAARQNAFWEMHDIVFEHQDDLEPAGLVSYAKHLKLDMAKFLKDMEDNQLVEKVESDFDSGVRSGVNGTPTFFINGHRYDGTWEETQFLEYLQEVLAAG